MYPLAQTIGHKVHQAGAKDAHGNPVDSWAAPVDVQVYGYGPRTDVRGSTGSGEPAGTQVLVGLQLLAPKGTVISPQDRIVIDGNEYEVDGEIGDWNNGPFGFEPGVVINLKRAEGGP
jgi:hypothetical protein